MIIINFVLAGISFGIFSFATITAIASLSRFLIKNFFQMLYPLTTESYNSLNRAFGFGFNSGVGRMLVIAMPFIIVPLAKYHLQLLLILLIAASLSGALTMLMIPETLNQPLDGEQNLEDSSDDE